MLFKIIWLAKFKRPAYSGLEFVETKEMVYEAFEF